MKDFKRSHETHFFYLATTYLACRLAAMGGTPIGERSHVPVTNFETLGWALLGMLDYSGEMRLVMKDWRDSDTVKPL